MPGPSNYRLPSDTFVVATSKENNVIQDYQSQVADPIATVKEATRQTLFSSKQTEVTERLAQVLAVKQNVKKPGEIAYFGEEDVNIEYGSPDWYCVICKVLDLHAVTPDPDMNVTAAGNPTFRDVTRMRSNIGKFYCPVKYLSDKGKTNIKIGDWLIVEFQDKILMSNGIIKDKYIDSHAAELKEIEEQNKAKEANYNNVGSVGGINVFSSPLENAQYINPFASIRPIPTSFYGMRTDPDTGQKKMHYGIDLQGSRNPGESALYSISAGIVERIDRSASGGEGLSIILKHKYWNNPSSDVVLGQSWYMHMDPKDFARGLTEGQFIPIGTFLGYQGNTGRKRAGPGGSGVHLHLQVYEGTDINRLNPIDPASLVDFYTTWTPGNPPKPDFLTDKTIPATPATPPAP
jgi:murein DD-endopeptidase MepM/ murein hydrolase activator NlpD